MDDDYQLLDRWRAGDRLSGNQLLRRHFDSLYRFFSNKVDTEVDDLIQRVFLSCIEAKEGFRKDASFRSWLFTVARNELYGHFRRKRKNDVDMGTMSVIELGTSPSSKAARLEEEQLLLKALRRIPVDLQITLELFYWEELSSAELADVLGIPLGTAKSRLRRAREALKDAMRREAKSEVTLKSTMDNFDHWARAVRQVLLADKA